MLKKFYMGGLILIILLTLVTYEKNKNSKGIDFTIGFEEIYINFPLGYEVHDLEKVVSTLEEWSDIYSKRGYLSELVYNDQFFVSNSLIVYAFTKGKGGNQMKIRKISKNGNALLVAVNVRLGLTEITTFGILIIEVKKDDIANTSNLQIIENSIG